MTRPEHRDNRRPTAERSQPAKQARISRLRSPEHRDKPRCHNCARRMYPARQVAHKQLYCSERCKKAASRAAVHNPVVAALTLARGEVLSGARLTPAAIRAIATLLALRPLDVDAPRPTKRIATKPAGPVAPNGMQGRTPLYPWPRNNANGRPLGVDFRAPSTKFVEVRKLLLSSGLRVNGLDFDDLHQIIVETMVRRNRMPSAYDPDKSSFGHYVHVLARNVCINLSIAQKRVPELTETGELGSLLDEGVDDPTERLELFESLTTQERAEAAQMRRTA